MLGDSPAFSPYGEYVTDKQVRDIRLHYLSEQAKDALEGLHD